MAGNDEHIISVEVALKDWAEKNMPPAVLRKRFQTHRVFITQAIPDRLGRLKLLADEFRLPRFALLMRVASAEVV